MAVSNYEMTLAPPALFSSYSVFVMQMIKMNGFGASLEYCGKINGFIASLVWCWYMHVGSMGNSQ